MEVYVNRTVKSAEVLGTFAWKRNAASQNNTKYAETALQLEIYLLPDGGILCARRSGWNRKVGDMRASVFYCKPNG